MFEPRPFMVLGIEPLVIGDTDSSYPSGHALIVGTGAYASLHLPLYLRIPLLLEALLVSYGRIYVGLHWPLDVVAGWLLGIGNVELIRSITDRSSIVRNIRDIA
jgi:membrane-associated phospholipid phosphatase